MTPAQHLWLAVAATVAALSLGTQAARLIFQGFATGQNDVAVFWIIGLFALSAGVGYLWTLTLTVQP